MNINTTIDFNEKKGFVCDMDGVIYHGNQILNGVREFIQWLHDEKKEYLFLTNNSGYTPRELNQKLARMGLDVSEEHFYTSALATAAFLKNQAPGCSVFAIGEAGLLNALYDAGITMNDVNPDYVVVGEGRSYSLDTLTKAINLVLKGAKLIGANSDVSGPIENGIAPGCRALVAPIEMATGTQAYFCGKPNPLMMRTGLNLLGCHSCKTSNRSTISEMYGTGKGSFLQRTLRIWKDGDGGKADPADREKVSRRERRQGSVRAADRRSELGNPVCR